MFCFVVFSLTSFFAYSQDSQAEGAVSSATHGWKEVQVPYEYQNIQVPREVWQTIKDILGKEGASLDTQDNLSVLPVGIHVDLSSDHRVVLKDGVNYRISYIEGGGDLDLFSYITGKGTFNIRFIPQLSSDSPYHLLYISDSPGKEIDGTFWGNQCGRIFDLSKNFNKFVFEEGITVTSSRRHYLHLMAGTFIFFQLVAEKLFISYIRILDSRYPNFNCRQT